LLLPSSIYSDAQEERTKRSFRGRERKREREREIKRERGRKRERLSYPCCTYFSAVFFFFFFLSMWLLSSSFLPSFPSDRSKAVVYSKSSVGAAVVERGPGRQLAAFVRSFVRPERERERERETTTTNVKEMGRDRARRKRKERRS
jgi:hypothetical protein